MEIKKAIYQISVTDKNKIINDNLPEFAFVGRSNVGKSSIINYLTNVKSLAKTSSTPGKTKMVNYFLINDRFRFVDLPGYGFSKTGKVHRQVWAGLIGDYLLNAKNLLNIFVLLDIRHLPSSLDKQMIDFLLFNNLPFTILATKADKLSKSKLNQSIDSIAKELNLRKEMIILTSSLNKMGKEKVLDLLQWKLEEFEENAGKN